MIPRSSDWGHSPLLMNLAYWSFIATIALFVTPYILIILLLAPGFVSGDRVTVSKGDTTVEIYCREGNLSEDEIRTAINEVESV